MKRLLTTILIFLGLLTVGVTLGANAASESLTKDGKTYNLVTTAEDLTDGNYIISYSDTVYMGALNGTYHSSGTLSDAIIWKIVITETGTTIQNTTNNLYLEYNGSKNYSFEKATGNINWTISLNADGTVKIANNNSTSRQLQYNTSSPRFACYTGSQKNPTLYKEQAADPEATYYDVTFDAQNDLDPTVYQVKENETVAQPSKPVKENYLFTGWYQEVECTNLFDFNTLITASITLYAGWIEDPYSYAIINGTNLKGDSNGSYASFDGSHIVTTSDGTGNEFSYTTSNVRFYSNQIQFRGSSYNPHLYNGTTVKGYISAIEIESITEGELNVYTSDRVINDVTGLTATTLNASNSIYDLPTDLHHTYFYISGANAKLSNIKIRYTYDETFAKYSIRFNAGKGVFKDGKGATISVNEGETYTGNVPTADDLEMTAYKYTTLVGWNDGVKTYAPGEAFEVNALTVFNAVYEASNNISVAQALEIAEITGSAKTTFNFKCEGIVVSAEVDANDDKKVSITLKDLTSNSTILVYQSKVNGNLYEGDKILVTGKITTFNGTTPEITDSAYKITDNLISSFTHTETMASLKATYDSNFMPVDVDLRFGAKIGLNSYNENASYGVMVIDSSIFDGFVAGASEYATADEFIAAHEGVKKMACPNGALLDDGYQFAWVITDMEGHYKTYFTAVIYMEYDGVLYLGTAKVRSVAQQASRYIEEADKGNVVLTADERKVLGNIMSNEEN